VPAYLGLTPGQDQSGASNRQLGITKTGDKLMRRLLVQGAQQILGPHGKDCDLRRWGLRLAGSGTNPKLKRRAVIAVARKLAVLLHRLWVTGEVYDPFRTARRLEQRAD
jgi:transposase